VKTRLLEAREAAAERLRRGEEEEEADSNQASLEAAMLKTMAQQAIEERKSKKPRTTQDAFREALSKGQQQQQPPSAQRKESLAAAYAAPDSVRAGESAEDRRARIADFIVNGGIAELERKLAKAVEREDYATAARLKQELDEVKAEAQATPPGTSLLPRQSAAKSAFDALPTTDSSKYTSYVSRRFDQGPGASDQGPGRRVDEGEPTRDQAEAASAEAASAEAASARRLPEEDASLLLALCDQIDRLAQEGLVDDASWEMLISLRSERTALLSRLYETDGGGEYVEALALLEGRVIPDKDFPSVGGVAMSSKEAVDEAGPAQQ